mgnify:CR=1 FL=1
MSNLIIDGMNAIAEIISNMTGGVEDTSSELRASLEKLTKKELIEMIIADKTKSTRKEPTQRDLLCTILKDPRCYALDYTEISETILANLNTKMKYSPANIAWYKSQLTIDGEELVARMTTADRRKLDRQIAMQALKSL